MELQHHARAHASGDCELHLLAMNDRVEGHAGSVPAQRPMRTERESEDLLVSLCAFILPTCSALYTRAQMQTPELPTHPSGIATCMRFGGGAAGGACGAAAVVTTVGAG